MRKNITIAIVVFLIAVLAVAGFVPLKNRKTNVAPGNSTVATTAPTLLNSLKGVLGSLGLNNNNESPGNAATSAHETANLAGNVQNNTGNSADNFSFAIFGDTKEFGANDPNGNLEKAVARVKDQNLAAVFVMGDLINSCDGGKVPA